MPTELEEVLQHESVILQQLLISSNASQLVEFLHHGNTQIRQIGTAPPHTGTSPTFPNNDAHPLFSAAENLLPYSKTQPSIFKTAQLAPVKDLKLLVKDYTVSWLRPLFFFWVSRLFLAEDQQQAGY